MQNFQLRFRIRNSSSGLRIQRWLFFIPRQDEIPLLLVLRLFWVMGYDAGSAFGWMF